MSKRTPISSRQAKIRWLQSNQNVWQGFAPDDLKNWSDIVKLMKADGLIAFSTYPRDVNLPGLIADAQLNSSV